MKKYFYNENGDFDIFLYDKVEKLAYKKWLDTLNIGSYYDIIKKNHTRRNNSSPYFRLGSCQYLGNKNGQAIFKGKSKKNIIIRQNDIEVLSPKLFNETVEEYFNK